MKKTVPKRHRIQFDTYTLRWVSCRRVSDNTCVSATHPRKAVAACATKVAALILREK